MANDPSIIYSILKEAQNVLTQMSQDDFIDSLNKVGVVLLQKVSTGKKVYIAGNGGSWSDADHFASELRAQFEKKGRPALPALALPISLSTLTAWGNDYEDGFENAMGRDLEAFAQPDDVLIAISTSGKAKNVRHTLKLAKQKNMVRIAISGNGSESQSFGNLADYHIIIPHTQTARIQEAYQIVIHILCKYIDTIDNHETT